MEDIVLRKILIVDDEKDFAKNAKDFFIAMNMEADYVCDGKSAIEYVKTNKPALVVLDINLGEMSGFDVCKEIRNITNIPIIFISARTSESDKIIALGFGGDDYVEKPFSLSLLYAKINASLRRCYDMNLNSHENKIVIDDIEIDLDERIVKVNNEIKVMTNKEFELLVYLVNNKNKVLKKDEIFNNVWGDKFGEISTVTVHIRKLRQKIEKDPNEPKYIKTIFTVGYKFSFEE